ncbi:pyridoxamine 5'-phosphate oxidase [Candidatus Sumerlaeota bacterium]|nr:pyridoxamine 5'-phosphate oxidase [Candidatus Sumerlaeota bacterium]
MDQRISDLRREYSLRGLSEAAAGSDPLALFQRWLDEALQADLVDPTAMTLATVGAGGQPSARTVLLKGFDERGFVFHTNLRSRKAREMESHPRAALVFLWAGLDRQVRVEGPTERLSEEESDAHFASRPRGAQLGAWASEQSEVIAGREVLEAQVRLLEGKYRGQEIPRPPHWGGIRVVPGVLEFWQGRPNRLHDRLRFTRQGDGTWLRERLAP